MEAYNSGERHFGENYVQSLTRRAAKLPLDINWHFIGHLQSNKANQLASIKNLYVIETVDSLKLARKLNKSCKDHERVMNIFLQVNSSGEGTKSGFPPEEVIDTIDVILKECVNLKPIGLMSIGIVGDLDGFEMMYKLKQDICEKHSIEESEFELSLGTSEDYEDAIKVGGATEVRVGSKIFGTRTTKNINTSSEEEEAEDNLKEQEENKD
jgi:pyridoxal phosphate enzyme (YggS family)